MMQQTFPLLILWRRPKTYLMVRNRFPTDQQNVLARLFNTPLKFMAQIAWHGRDDGLCFSECRLENRFLAAVH